jgi:hypothetical protein
MKKYTSFHRNQNMRGSGWKRDLARIAKAKLSMKPRFKGEAHSPIVDPQGQLRLGEYIGPGTQILKRVQLLEQGNRDVKPVSIVDQVAEIHDIDYQLASDSKTKKEQLAKVRKADLDMLKRLKKIKKKKLDKKANIILGEKGIGAKVGIEKQGKSVGTAVGFALGGPAGALVGRLLGSKGQSKLKDIAGPLTNMTLTQKKQLKSAKSKANQDLENFGVGAGLLQKIGSGDY